MALDTIQMLNVKSLAVLVALGVLSVTASQSNGGQERISVYACKDPWWGGQCRTFYGGRNECGKQPFFLLSE